MGFLGTLECAFNGRRARSSAIFVEPSLIVYTNWKDERTSRVPRSRRSRGGHYPEPRVADPVDRAENPIASDRARVDPELGGIFQVLRIVMHREKRALQRLGAIRRQGLAARRRAVTAHRAAPPAQSARGAPRSLTR